MEFTQSDLYFIQSALNAYWAEAAFTLDRKDLGDIERQNFELQKKRSKELMDKVEKIILRR